MALFDRAAGSQEFSRFATPSGNLYCVLDSPCRPPSCEPDAPIVGCGGIATWPDTTVTCVLERFGITCVDPASEQGYFLARGRYQLF